MAERGATEEVAATLRVGERFAGKFDRHGFARNFYFGGAWRGQAFSTKQIEVIAVYEDSDWLVISVIVVVLTLVLLAAVIACALTTVSVLLFGSKRPQPPGGAQQDREP
jgi:glutamine amidotransferase-like uncharacterized protein